jgi:hypothetical protein
MINTTGRKQPLTANLLKPLSCQIPWLHAHGFYSQLDAGSLGSVSPSLGQERVKKCKDTASGAPQCCLSRAGKCLTGVGARLWRISDTIVEMDTYPNISTERLRTEWEHAIGDGIAYLKEETERIQAGVTD